MDFIVDYPNIHISRLESLRAQSRLSKDVARSQSYRENRQFIYIADRRFRKRLDAKYIYIYIIHRVIFFLNRLHILF